MGKQAAPTTGDAVRLVLEAESRAKEHLARAEDEADRIVEQARAGARRLEERSLESIRGIQRRTAARTATRLGELRLQCERRLAAIDSSGARQGGDIRAAARRLARQLIGWRGAPDTDGI